MLDAESFIKSYAKPQKISFLDDMELYQVEKMEPVWHKLMELTKDPDLPPPFWAFPWAGGQGLSRYILDNPDVVEGKRVFDFASGSGMVAIAASLAGAKKLRACDIDYLAQISISMNARLNNVKCKIRDAVDLGAPLKGFDVILAGDVCYNHVMGNMVVKWLRLCAMEGATVLLGDPGRAYTPRERVDELASYTVPTTLEIEDSEVREVKVYAVHP